MTPKGCEILLVFFERVNMNIDKKKNKIGIKIRLLWPVGLGVLLLLASSIIILEGLQNKKLNTEINDETERVTNLFAKQLESEAISLTGLLKTMERDPQLEQLWLKKDRQSLLDYANGFFQDICLEQAITHYCFHDIDQVCFLRVHQPQRYGDTINRLTMQQAVCTGKLAWGIELGPLGTFTLRVVKPWRIDGRTQGYLELGKEVESFSEKISKLIDVELFFFINKDYLSRSDWEEGMRMLNRESNWDEFKQFVLVSNSLGFIPDKLNNHFHTTEKCMSEEHHKTVLMDISLGKKHYRGKAIRLIDAGKRKVGDIFVLVDTTEAEALIHHLSSTLTIAYFVMFCVLVGVLYFYFKNIRQKLNTTYENLNTEIKLHKKAKNQIAQQNKFLNNVIESLSYPFYVVDVNTYRVTIANTTAMDLKLASNTTCYSATHKTDTPCCGDDHPCPLDIVKKTHQPAIVEHVHYDRNNNPIDVEVHCYPIFNANGKLTHAIEYSLDITERKKMQKHLKKAKIEAEKANRLKSEFLANMSHEIRTPLNSIVGFSEILTSEKSLNSEQREYADIIINNGRLLLNLINDILDLSKIEAGKLELDFSDSDLKVLCRNLNAVIRPAADKKNIAFTIDLDKDLPEAIRTDHFRLQQCLLNLAANAVKFTLKGSVSVHFYPEEILGKKYLRIDVKDTGIGIPKSKLETVFEAFTQADGSTSRKFGGTGLGLTITRRLITMLGGELFIDSKLDIGSVFSIQLPLEPQTKTVNETEDVNVSGAGTIEACFSENEA